MEGKGEMKTGIHTGRTWEMLEPEERDILRQARELEDLTGMSLQEMRSLLLKYLGNTEAAAPGDEERVVQYRQDKQNMLNRAELAGLIRAHEREIDCFTQQGNRIRFAEGMKYILGDFLLEMLLKENRDQEK